MISELLSMKRQRSTWVPSVLLQPKPLKKKVTGLCLTGTWQSETSLSHMVWIKSACKGRHQDNLLWTSQAAPHCWVVAMYAARRCAWLLARWQGVSRRCGTAPCDHYFKPLVVVRISSFSFEEKSVRVTKDRAKEFLVSWGIYSTASLCYRELSFIGI